MKVNTLFIITAIFCFFFGITNLLIPTTINSNYGITMTAAHIFTAQIMGAANLGIAFLLLFSRKSKDTKGIVIGMFVFHIIGFVVSLLAMLNKVMSSSGWSAVGIFLILSIGWAYFLFKK